MKPKRRFPLRGTAGVTDDPDAALLRLTITFSPRDVVVPPLTSQFRYYHYTDNIAHCILHD